MNKKWEIARPIVYSVVGLAALFFVLELITYHFEPSSTRKKVRWVFTESVLMSTPLVIFASARGIKKQLQKIGKEPNDTTTWVVGVSILSVFIALVNLRNLIPSLPGVVLACLVFIGAVFGTARFSEKRGGMP
jgi:uncharacterized membrane protein HdeD (DUF308 family)